jgi:long-subunit acyl-CoA synthetase (AMP-forming)
VLAIVVPHRRALEGLAAKKGIEGDYETLCKNLEIRCEIVNYLNKIGKDAGLAGFEQAKNVHI